MMATVGSKYKGCLLEFSILSCFTSSSLTEKTKASGTTPTARELTHMLITMLEYVTENALGGSALHFRC